MYIMTNTKPVKIINLANCISVEVNEKEKTLYATGNNGERYLLHSFESGSLIDAIKLIYERLEEGCPTLDMRDAIGEVLPAPERKKAPPKRLIVTLKDGTVIERGTQASTFVEAIETAGIEKVHALKLQSEDYPLTRQKNTDEQPGSNRTSDSSGFYSIRTVYSADGKKEILDTISDKLNLQWDVKVISK